MNRWKTKPNRSRRSAVRNRSGRPETTAPSSSTRPEVGRAMQPTMESSVVLPEPDGPLSTVTASRAISRLTPRSAATSLGRPSL
ncbi:MAG: hypothetical protein R3D80_14565 [Paracoccaceae bacterium]